MSRLSFLCFAICLAAPIYSERLYSAQNEELESFRIRRHKGNVKQINVFHINLSWECMSLPPFGSGKPAAVHCKPGKFHGNADPIPEWRASNVQAPISPEWKQGEQPWSSLVTSCTNTFLHKMLQWKEDKKYDVITMVELANPGINGFKYLGRTEDTLPDLGGKQQIDPKVYEILSEKVLAGYGVFGNVISGRNIVVQATYWNKAVLGECDLALGFNLLVQDGRPVSALFFEAKKTLVLNVHSAHFRKTLLSSGYAAFGKDSQGKVIIEEMAKTIDPNFKGGDRAAASISAFGTDKLQDLFGKWLSYKLIEELKACKANPNKHHTEINGYCKVSDTGKALLNRIPEDWSEGDWASWKIIVAGDFNDETMELSKFKVLDIEVGVKPKDRKRTCCSDRDLDFKKALKGEEDPLDAPRFIDGVPLHTAANTDYITSSCGYFSNGTAFDNWLKSHPDNNPMLLDSAKKVLPAGLDQNTNSLYPWPSDMILGSANIHGDAIEFPFSYAERMSTYMFHTKDYAVDPAMPGSNEPDASRYSNGMISDHDPIQRSFEWIE
eukprot:TRINITY_DN15174_c4_g1_i1.p1 TRINITY_DN15174_c4_g1~~TRINITY_DN15174_c4_g1_i1.p1  ORF type:complete len:552 (+),score=91.34 TRINITY_DN15174_c4_g1_i1:101-1756(+)